MRLSLRTGIIALVFAGVLTDFRAATIVRGRNEGMSIIPASNVMGSGDITSYAVLGGGVGADGLRFDPAVGGQIGIGGILQFSAQMIPYSLKVRGLGPVEAHLQATLPRNDRLRFFGLAIRADLFLSTAQDTISKTADKGKPDYNPSLLPSLIVDFDMLAKWKRFPLKAYLMADMADAPQLLFRYDQIAARLGAEWKMVKHGIFAEAGMAFYKERASRLNNNHGDNSYSQMYAWVQPGGRFRFLTRFSVVGGLRITFAQRLKDVAPIKPEVVALTLRLEAPIYFRETNTEAIRTLVFMEQEKTRRAKAADSVKAAQNTGGFGDEFNLGFGPVGDSTETFDYSRETQELVRQRQEIQEKMEEIQQLFEGLDEDAAPDKQGGQK